MKKQPFNIATLTVIVLIFNACGQKNSNEKKVPDLQAGQKKATVVKLSPVVFGGNRYVVEADFGLEHKVPMMIHGNASFYMMVTHDIAEQLNGGKPIKKIRDYGYSKKGMGMINVAKFQIGDKTFSNAENVRVFDWPEEEGKAAQGMLGILFLSNENVRIDFTKEQMEIGVALNDQPDKSLIDQGYTFTKFFVENGEGYMYVHFDDLDKDIPITVGTVSDEYSLDLVTFKNGVKVEKTDSKGNSPSRTAPVIYTNAVPVKYRIANQSFEIPVRKSEIYSFAEYENVDQSKLFPFGIFGRDWMKENNAILDYANKFLYFKNNKMVKDST
jgi:hypothetical protein